MRVLQQVASGRTESDALSLAEQPAIPKTVQVHLWLRQSDRDLLNRLAAMGLTRHRRHA